MVWAARSMVRAVSKYSLLSISPPQSQFERQNAVELQPITERRTGPLHRRSSVPYICMRRGYLGLRSTTCAPREWWERGSSPGGYLATSVDQLVTLMFAKYAREAAKALPSDKAYPPRGSEKRTARASNGLALGLISVRKSPAQTNGRWSLPIRLAHRLL